MAFIAKHMKQLAQSELPPEKRTDVGRVCNKISAFFNPIDEAGDAGNMAATKEISDKMDVAIKKLETLTNSFLYLERCCATTSLKGLVKPWKIWKKWSGFIRKVPGKR